MFKVYRDCDARFRLRKVVVELYGVDGSFLDRRRMFGGLLFALRLKLKQHRMVKFGKLLTAYTTVD